MSATTEAYSVQRYGQRQWRRSIELLAQRGLTDLQIRAVLLSKWMRWAADTNGRATARGLMRFMDDPRNLVTPEEIQKLTAETFPKGYDDVVDYDER
ncbi:MAG: hypothetical protein ACO3AG_07330 [Fluviibacter sp.]